VNSAAALEAVERVLNRGGEPEYVLRTVLEALHARGISYAAVRFAGRELATGEVADAVEAPIVFDGAKVGTLALCGADAAFVGRVTTLISPYVRSTSIAVKSAKHFSRA
jgi:hypothetical protein